MNILLIGNGFDLAHNLPTKYTDFLEFIKVIKQIIQGVEINKIDWGKTTETQIKLMIEAKMGNIRNNIFAQKDLWTYLLHDNVWVGYFLHNKSYIKENWIDFESEISRVIQSIDDDMQRMKADDSKTVLKISEQYFEDYFVDTSSTRNQEREPEIMQSLAGKIIVAKESEYEKKYMKEHLVGRSKEEITYKQLIKRLYKDMNKLIRALEIYLVEYVNEMNIDISDFFMNLDLNYILSFNYTDVYEKNYSDGCGIEFDYIHGKAIYDSYIKDNEYDKLIEKNNMVLGIDEYLPKKRRNKDLDFIAFKKFYQRIYKQTGCKYKDWINRIKRESSQNKEEIFILKKELVANKGSGIEGVKIKNNLQKLENKSKNNLYIFGHSLDITDKDILKEFILCDNVVTTVFYPNNAELGRKIANLVKIIGQKELIRRTGGDVATIRFVLQQEI